MLKPIPIIVIFCIVTVCAAYAARAAWIWHKIAMLSAPASEAYALSNANLPAKGRKPRVLLIGDSRIARWPIAALGDNWEIINRGISGETVQQLAKRFNSDAIALNPDVIVIESGINDLVAASLMNDAEKSSVARNVVVTLRQLASRATAVGTQTIIATIIPPAKPDLLRLAVWMESLRDLVIVTNSELRLSHWADRAHLIDLVAFLTPVDDGKLPEEYRKDTLHLNEIGYKRLTGALALRLSDLLGDDQKHDRQ